MEKFFHARIYDLKVIDREPRSRRPEAGGDRGRRMPRKRSLRSSQGQACGDRIVGLLRAAVSVGEVARAEAPCLRLARGVLRSGDDRRACGLVRGGGVVQASARIAHPAHRHHPREPGSLADSLAAFIEVISSPRSRSRKSCMKRISDWAPMDGERAAHRQSGGIPRQVVARGDERRSGVRLKGVGRGKTREAIEGFDIGPWASTIMAALVEGRRYRTILDESSPRSTASSWNPGRSRRSRRRYAANCRRS